MLFTEFEDFVSDGESALHQMIEQGTDDTVYVGGGHGEVKTDHKTQLDHSNSLLFEMSIQQLRQLFLSLQQKLHGKVKGVGLGGVPGLCDEQEVTRLESVHNHTKRHVT